MGDKIISIRYYRIEFQLASALFVGSGQEEMTDGDIMRDSRGIPYIPATGLTGLYRPLFTKEEAERYFGKIGDLSGEEKAENSRLITYDAVLKEQAYRVSNRDGVGLDEWKTAKTGAKFDFEILEPGVTFVTYIEQNKQKGDQNAGDRIALAWRREEIAIGGKTSRGLGRIKNAVIKALEFSMEKENEILDWLDFDLYHDQDWERYSKKYGQKLLWTGTKAAPQKLSVRLALKQKGPIAIRTYSAKKKQGVTQPDYEQLVYIREEDGEQKEIPVVPGTSWAGAFRHHMRKLDPSCIGEQFGVNAEKKSGILFGESEIRDAVGKIFTRNAIDRFTGGAVENALYTEKVYYGGHTELDITVMEKDTEENFLKCLAAAIVDLQLGFLSVGGETSVGRGLF